MQSYTWTPVCPDCGAVLTHAGEKEIAVIRHPVVREYGAYWTEERMFDRFECCSETCLSWKDVPGEWFEGRDGNLHSEEAIRQDEDR